MTNQSLTSSSNVPLPKQFGGSLDCALVQGTYLEILDNIEAGSRNGSQEGMLSIPVAVQLYAGPFGRAGIKHALTRK